MTKKTLRLLFVCTGNTCRSPMARFLLERRAREAGLPWTADSAGIAAAKGQPMTEPARRALAARGIEGVKHSSQPLNEEKISQADRIYAMTREHREAVLNLFPAAAPKLAVLREAAGLPGADVPDPIGKPDTIYESSAALIDEALDIIVRRNANAHSR